MSNKPTLTTLADDLGSGRTSARKLVEACIAKIADPSGEGQRAFIHVDKDAAIAAADAMDHLRKAKAAPSRFAGIPISIKDLFDIKGQVTRAGSRALDDSPPAAADATAVARLRRADHRDQIQPLPRAGRDRSGRVFSQFRNAEGFLR